MNFIKSTRKLTFSQAAYLLLLLLLVSCGAPSEPELGAPPALCQPGQGLVPNGEGCEACPPGTFNDQEGQVECQVCPPGTYQEETGSTECLPCPPPPQTGLADGQTPEPFHAACQPLGGSIIGAPGAAPTSATQSDDPDEEKPDEPSVTSTPLALTGFWYHQSSPGQLTCAGFSKTVDAIIGTISVELIEDGAKMIMHGIPDFDPLTLNKVEENKYQAVINTSDGVVTVTVYVRSPILMEGEILGQYTGGCEFKRTFQLDKQG